MCPVWILLLYSTNKTSVACKVVRFSCPGTSVEGLVSMIRQSGSQAGGLPLSLHSGVSSIGKKGANGKDSGGE